MSPPASRSAKISESSAHHCAELGCQVGGLAAPQVVALVAHDAEDLGIGEVAAPRRHRRPVAPEHDVRTALAVGVAVDVDTGRRVLLGAEVHESQLVLDVGEGLEHLAVDERVADAALPSPPWQLAQTAVGVGCRRRAGRRRPAACVVTARAYMNAQSGSRASASIAQNGIRLRRL